MNREEFDKTNVFGKGNSNDNYAKYFVGNSYLNPLVDPNDSPLFLANVTFEPSCRNNWHIHHAKSGGRTNINMYSRLWLVSIRRKRCCIIRTRKSYCYKT